VPFRFLSYRPVGEDEDAVRSDLLGVVFTLHTYDERTTAESATPPKNIGASPASFCEDARTTQLNLAHHLRPSAKP
jgi:hypothetical protein